MFQSHGASEPMQFHRVGMENPKGDKNMSSESVITSACTKAVIFKDGNFVMSSGHYGWVDGWVGSSTRNEAAKLRGGYGEVV